MITVKHETGFCPDPYLISRGIDPDKAVFFDIETTGLKAEYSHLYLIGAAHRLSSGRWQITQWLAEKPQEEAALLRTFNAYVLPFTTLIHFNGNRFDIPYLLEKENKYGLDPVIGQMASEDLYLQLRPLRKMLRMAHMNQKSLEAFMGIRRRDPYDGGQLIGIYRSWIKEGGEERLEAVLLHNREDVEGMLLVSGMYAYLPLADPMLEAQIRDFEQQWDDLVYMVIRTPSPYGWLDSLLFIDNYQDEWEFASQELKDGYVLYDLTIAADGSPKAVASKIRQGGLDVVVETSIDGNMPDPIVFIVAALLVFAILFLMCESWVEPLLFLTTIGAAVLLNMGSNALLPSVSMTTHSIVAILQLVLSMDYSIILMNCYRQKLADGDGRESAMLRALAAASPSVLSSAFTTMAGLLMLCFMKFRIGMDLGFVLAKGVLCSVLCLYTILVAWLCSLAAYHLALFFWPV